jgi:arylsulfatase A-like enzyme
MMMSVDEAIGDLIDELDDEGILDDTYVIFASDNGFFRGEHRIVSGKYLPYDPAARIPLMIRGPGIPEGVQSDELVSAIDIPQTVREIATGAEDPDADGRSFLPYAMDPTLRSKRPLLLEADTGPGQGNSGFDPQSASAARARAARLKLARLKGVKDLNQEPMGATKSVANGNFAPAYRAIRTDRYLYVLYSNGQSELYDLLLDPAQLRSVHADRRYRFVRAYLFGELIGLSTCDAGECREEIGSDPLPVPGKKPKKRKR